jgi:hypothetical protein
LAQVQLVFSLGPHVFAGFGLCSPAYDFLQLLSRSRQSNHDLPLRSRRLQMLLPAELRRLL